MIMQRHLKLGLLALIAASPVIAGPPVFSLLENSRAKIKLPNYSSAEKRLVFEQASLIINQVYVHKELKLKDFGVNPTPALKMIEENLETSTSYEFHKSMADIFYSFRDKHTLYYLPRPFSCYNNFLPFNLREVLNDQNQSVIAVSSLEDTDTVKRLINKPMQVIPGDILISIDGVPVEEAMKKVMLSSLGANDAAARRGAINELIFKEHTLDFLPEKDRHTLVFKTRLGKTFTEELPWITRADWSCLGKAQGDSSNKSFPAIPKKKERKRIWGGISNEETILHSHIIANQYGDFGYLRLDSFVPEVMNEKEIILKIKNILKNDFAQTDGLIIDIRNNGGGDVTISERMIQLFSPKAIKPMGDIMKATAATLHYMEHVSPNDPFTIAGHEAMQTGAAYTVPLALINVEEMNDIGQFYFKPIAVFTNSFCYSSCDMFAAQMQDYKLATIFGEDDTTGAGGANRFTLSKWIDDLGKNNGPYEALPRGQDIMFAFRQSLRNGVNAGKLVEDEGIKSDRLAKPTIADLFSDDADQLRIISKYLNQQSENFVSQAALESDERQDIIVGKKPTLVIKWADTTSISFKENRVQLESTNVEANKPEGQTFILPIENKTPKSGRLEILGSKNFNPAWRKIYNYRVVPNHFTVANALTIAPTQFAFYTTNTPAATGWTVAKNSLQIGDGVLYEDKLVAEASLFITPLKAFMLNFNADIQSEEGGDFFKVVVVQDGQETILLEKLSGTIAAKNYSLDLSAYLGKKIEIRFVFESDEYIAKQGVKLADISLAIK